MRLIITILSFWATQSFAQNRSVSDSSITETNTEFGMEHLHDNVSGTYCSCIGNIGISRDSLSLDPPNIAIGKKSYRTTKKPKKHNRKR